MQSGRQIEGVRYLLVTLVAAGFLFPAAARAQPCQHGASIFKTCESVKRTCTNNADCDDHIQCTNDVCDTGIGNTTNCSISLAHADTCGDVTKITEAFDIDDFGVDNVRTPPAGNLPISGVFNNAVCCAGPVLPCFVGPAGLATAIPAATTGCGVLNLPGAAAAGIVTFQSNTYVIQPDDQDPLPNQGNVRVQDLCNSGPVGCNTGVNTVQFTASTDLVTGCTNANKPGSTPCADIDGNLCTTAGCDGFGSCDQAHLDTPCPPDSNDCTSDLACDPQTGQCPHPPVPDSTPCGDTDQNACTTAGCEAGQCVQTHVSTPCPPDSNACTQDPPCNPSNGLCEHPPVPDSSPCGDTDQNLCTTPGCEAGQCVQTHITTPCPADSNECTSDPACNPATGLCAHPPVPDSTPCTDTDANSCTGSGCEQGQCVQSHINNCPPPIDHVQCYEAKPASFAVRTVTAQDQFGTLPLQIRFPHRLCAPANKNGEGIIDPTEHLTGYKAKAKFTKSLNHTVTNQFGTLKLDVVRPDLFMVPTAKDGVALTPPPGDHFTCYKVRRSRGTPKFVPISVSVADQLQTVTETLTKPIRLCAPANKNNENPGAQNHPDHLLCYKTKTTTQFGDIVKPIENQFGQTTLRLIHRRELCVPSLKDPSGTSTTSTTVATTSSTAAPTTVATTSTTSTTVIGSPSGAFAEDRS
jgi:hypothetical protein